MHDKPRRNCSRLPVLSLVHRQRETRRIANVNGSQSGKPTNAAHPEVDCVHYNRLRGLPMNILCRSLPALATFLLLGQAGYEVNVSCDTSTGVQPCPLSSAENGVAAF